MLLDFGRLNCKWKFLWHSLGAGVGGVGGFKG